MAGPSKEERKRLRRQMEESTRQTDGFSHVISRGATRDVVSPEAIIADAERLGVVLACRQTGDSFVFSVPGGPPQLCVVLGYSTFDDDLIRVIERFEWMVKDRDFFEMGMPVVNFRAKVRLDPTIHFLNATITRVLGRLAKGVLASDITETVMDDWISWSLDYLGPNMWHAMWTYGTDRVDAAAIALRYPELRKSGMF